MKRPPFQVVRAHRGDKLFRVEWTRDKPSVEEYVVTSGSVNGMIVTDSKGKDHTLIGIEAIRMFGASHDDAIERSFQLMAAEAAMAHTDVAGYLKKAGQLATLLKTKTKK